VETLVTVINGVEILVRIQRLMGRKDGVRGAGLHRGGQEHGERIRIYVTPTVSMNTAMPKSYAKYKVYKS